MNILHLLKSTSFSGAENVAITIIKNLEDNYKAAYVSPKGTIEKRLKNEDIRYYPVDEVSIKEVKEVISDFHPDIIHAHDFTASVIAGLTGTEVPIISHLHNNTPWLKRPGIYSLAYLAASRNFKIIYGVSESIFNEYIFSRFIKNKTKVISNPINIEEIIMKSNEETQLKYDIIFIGRLSEEKNPLKFIELMSKIIQRNPNVRIAMIGDGDLEKECIEKIKYMNLTNNIDMLGFIDNPYNILSNCKLLCMTSTWEGFGLVAIEALTLSIPVVAYPVGGLPEFINDSCGLLTFDDNEYIREVDSLINNEAYRKVKSYNAVIQAKKMNNINEYMNRLMEDYKQIANKDYLL